MENREKIIDYFRNFDILNPSTNRIGQARFIDFSLNANRPDTRGNETVHDLHEIDCGMERLLQKDESLKTNEPISNVNHQYDTYFEEEYFDYNSEDDEELVLKVMPRHDGQFELEMTISDYYYPYLIGRNGINLRKLQEQCEAKIQIPSTNDTVTIIGKSERVVLMAKRILELEVAKIHSRLEPNYYLAVPIDNVVIRKNFDLFKRKICSGNYVSNLNGKLVEETFVSGERLHITIGMLKLFSETAKLQINQHLKICNETILEPFLRENGNSLSFNVKGVDSFTDDPTMVRVVFAKILNETGRNHEQLQTLLESIRKYFCDQQLIDDGKNNGPLQMHMTLMNTKYLQNDEPGRQQRILMDCEKLFKEFANFNFGTESMTGIKVVPRLHLYRSNV